MREYVTTQKVTSAFRLHRQRRCDRAGYDQVVRGRLSEDQEQVRIRRYRHEDCPGRAGHA